MKKRIGIVLVGEAGRMGQAIREASTGDAAVEIIAGCEVGDAVEPLIARADVTIDFSHANAITDVCAAVAQHKRALVIGTTGHSAEQRATIEKCAMSVPIVLASNFSVGVNTLFWLTGRAAALLGPDFDLEIVEMHHRMKKDAPSGTALTLAEILTTERNLKTTRHGRQGEVGERSGTELGIHSLRGGDVVGDHTVIFAGNGERLELTHRATSRQTFAKGALRAAAWVVGQSAGLYSMQDVLGLPAQK
jgi:4-hydroxy-tetrahydrodipicolinate reductase